MPIFEYKCDKCGQIIEKLEKSHSDSIKESHIFEDDVCDGTLVYKISKSKVIWK